jgi:hypothetical protein
VNAIRSGCSSFEGILQVILLCCGIFSDFIGSFGIWTLHQGFQNFWRFFFGFVFPKDVLGWQIKVYEVLWNNSLLGMQDRFSILTFLSLNFILLLECKACMHLSFYVFLC